MRQFKTQSLSLVTLCPETNKLKLTAQAKHYLQSLQNPVAVVTIAGLYRTGKSFLINKLIPAYSQYQPYINTNTNTNTNLQQAFTVGSSTQSMTKGLSILATPITLHCQKTNKLIDYLLIDSEGIGSCQQSIKYDMDLLILIFLISSTVVYNTMGAIDQNSLEQLQAVLKLKSCVESAEVQYGEFRYKCAAQPPKLVWVLRDFSLQLVDKNGREMTPDQYLKQCLEESSSSSLESRKKNEIRKAIKQNLRSHHCITLVRPTIKQQQLQHLSTYKNYQQKQTKLRAQFLGQVQNLRELLFPGSKDDIKRVNGEQLSGRLFARIVQQYLQVINEDQLPRVSDIWQQISKQGDQQYFQDQIAQLKKQINSIKLPLSKQQLKLKINQLQTRISRNLSSHITNKSSLSSYQSQYIAIVQKLNCAVKTKNTQLRTSSLLTQLHHFVKQNIKYQQFKPSNIAEIVSGFIERVKMKGKCQENNQEIMEYLFSVLNDIVFIVGQKWGKIQRQFTQIKQIFDKINLDKSNTELSLMNLKRQYHQSLKSIAKLQQNQADIDKNYVLTQSKIANYQNKIGKLEMENKHDKQVYQRNVKEIQEKYRNKIEDLTTQLKKIKDINTQTQQQLASTRQKLSQYDMKSKKQVIFQQKIKQSFDKFHEQRTILNRQIDSYKKQLANINEKYTEMKYQYEAQCQKQKQLEESHLRREQNFMKQFQILKQTMKQTKASRDKTYETYISTQQKLSMCVPLSTAKKQKFMTPGKQIKKDEVKIQTQQQPQTVMTTDQDNNKLIKKYYECQIQKLSEEHQIEIKRLEQKIDKLEKQLERKQTDKSIYFMEAKQYKQKCYRLEQDILVSNSKFNEFLKDLEHSKQKQRTLYEESIVRLLNNIERRDRDGDRDQYKINVRPSKESMQSRESRESKDRSYGNSKRIFDEKQKEKDSFLNFVDRNSLSSIEINTNINRRKTSGKNNEQNVSQSHSFGNNCFKTK